MTHANGMRSPVNHLSSNISFILLSWQGVPSQRCGSAKRSSGKWYLSKWHAQQWDGRRSSVACAGAQRDVLAQILRRWRLLSLERQHGQLVVDALFNRQSVQRLKQRVDVWPSIWASIHVVRYIQWIQFDKFKIKISASEATVELMFVRYRSAENRQVNSVLCEHWFQVLDENSIMMKC